MSIKKSPTRPIPTFKISLIYFIYLFLECNSVIYGVLTICVIKRKHKVRSYFKMQQTLVNRLESIDNNDRLF